MDQAAQADTVNVLLVTITAHKMAINNLTRQRLARKYQVWEHKLLSHTYALKEQLPALKAELDKLLEISGYVDSAGRLINLDASAQTVLNLRSSRASVLVNLRKALSDQARLPLPQVDGERLVQEYAGFMVDEFDDLERLVALGDVVHAWVGVAYDHIACDHLDRATTTLERVRQRLVVVQQELKQ